MIHSSQSSTILFHFSLILQNNYNRTFGFAKGQCEGKMEKITSKAERDSSFPPKSILMYGTVPLFIVVKYNFVWDYKHAHKAIQLN